MMDLHIEEETYMKYYIGIDLGGTNIVAGEMCIRDRWYHMVWLEKHIGSHEGTPLPVLRG